MSDATAAAEFTPSSSAAVAATDMRKWGVNSKWVRSSNRLALLRKLLAKVANYFGIVSKRGEDEEDAAAEDDDDNISCSIYSSL